MTPLNLRPRLRDKYLGISSGKKLCSSDKSGIAEGRATVETSDTYKYRQHTLTAHPSERWTSLDLVEEGDDDMNVSVAVKVSRGMDETNELSRTRSLNVESSMPSFCELCE